jgi:hypothetical protein
MRLRSIGSISSVLKWCSCALLVLEVLLPAQDKPALPPPMRPPGSTISPSFRGLARSVRARFPTTLKKDFPALDARANQQLHLLWIACGTEDRLITVNRNLRERLKTKGVKATEIETPGMHTWMVWRRNLAEFVPLLFR